MIQASAVYNSTEDEFMPSYIARIRRRYGRPNLDQALMASLAADGKDLSRLTRHDFRHFEEFHLRGRRATRHLAALAGTSEGMSVLDLGCGVGGAARTLAAEHGCLVIGLDLSAAYTRAAGALSSAVGLASRTLFEVADAQRIPHAASAFDLAWMQHACMNIPDKGRLLGELRRVLRPGGKFAFYEIFQQPGAQLAYPLPWADNEGLTFLTPIQDFQRQLSQASFRAVHWQDVTADLIAWGQQPLAPADSQRAISPELALVIGVDYPVRTQNLLDALSRGDLRVVQAVYTRVDP
jgi:ubiquinone/menaquinone biosynthesis C-methylase UbiE